MNGFIEMSNAIKMVNIIYVWTGGSLNRVLVFRLYSFSFKLYQTIMLQQLQHCKELSNMTRFISYLY